MAGAVEGPAGNDPPTSPAVGETYVVGSTPTGEWSAYADHVAAYGPGGWRFVAPLMGIALVEKTSGMAVAYGPLGWETGIVRASRVLVNGQQVVGQQAGAIAEPVGGGVVDTEARTVIAEMLSALRQHGLISA